MCVHPLEGYTSNVGVVSRPDIPPISRRDVSFSGLPHISDPSLQVTTKLNPPEVLCSSISDYMTPLMSWVKNCRLNVFCSPTVKLKMSMIKWTAVVHSNMSIQKSRSLKNSRKVLWRNWEYQSSKCTGKSLGNWNAEERSDLLENSEELGNKTQQIFKFKNGFVFPFCFYMFHCLPKVRCQNLDLGLWVQYFIENNFISF